MQQKGVPRSLFTWIKMARGYEGGVGRSVQGVVYPGSQLKPLPLERQLFTPGPSAVYIVFEVARLKIQLSSLVRVGVDGKGAKPLSSG